ncbi:unnamed protein product [Blepharisma stoltei]|uniref:Major facilitator superfamily (MFS) profile domain-containing protein n=1 Tax=Blepharisma stoltei TaxID=1481888 RepID=A0AAU9I7P9_9CILI|nr:unnamed protein product [Blepharisma stoltei]
MASQDEKTNSYPNKLSPLEEFKYSISEILKSPRELHILYLINLSLSFQYYLITTLIPLFFTDIQEFSDLLSGTIFGFYGISLGLGAIILNPLANRFGLKFGLSISCIFGLIGFLLLAVTYNLSVNLVSVLTFQTISGALAWPVVEFGIKIYTRQDHRNFANSLCLMSNYLAGVLTGFYIDIVWHYYEDDKHTLYKIFFYTGAGFAFFALILALVLRQNEVIEDGYLCDENIGELSKKIVSKKRFWRFFALICLLILLRSGCFGHLDATFPKYVTRTLGDDAHFGYLLAVHQTTMLIGVIFFTYFTYIYSSYTLICIGGIVGTLAPLLILGGSNYGIYAIFVILISCGEALWVPRLLDYTMSIAPNKEEGVYLALCNFPFYFAMIITGIASGILLDEYCPDEDNAGECYKVWLIIVFSTILVPILIWILRNILEQPDYEDKPYLKCFEDSKDLSKDNDEIKDKEGLLKNSND